MGNCALGSRNATSKNYSFATEPAGTEALRDKTLPRLLFHATLANVQLRQYPYPKATALFRMREGEHFSLSAKSSNETNTIMWRVQESFDFQMTEYELRKQFMEVSVLREDGTLVSNIRINLFLITTGPSHQDFALAFPEGQVGRISFDLKISQIIDIKISSLESEILFHKKHPGEEFSYSIKTINGFSGTSIESEFSYPAVVLLQNKADENEQNLQDVLISSLNRRKSNRELPLEIREGGELRWTKQRGELPIIETKVVASELQNIYFQILIWKYCSELESTKQLFADSYVSLYKLLATEAEVVRRDGKDMEQRNICMTEKIQHSGKHCGTGTFHFTILNQTYFKQYLLCVHTQQGIVKTNPIFGVEGTKSIEKCESLKILLSLSDSVEQKIIGLSNLQTEEGQKRRVRRIVKEIDEDLDSIYQLLEKSSFSQGCLYSYSSEKQLLEGQKILIELGVNITQFISSEDPYTKDLCWLILISLIKRGQFSLTHMGFNDKQKREIDKNCLSDILLFKQEVGNMYRALLHRLLDLALNSIDHKGSDYERTFAEVFTAFAYFRIPEFRKLVLRLVTRDSDPQIMEWRNVDFNLTFEPSQRVVRDKSNTFREMFDWQHHFYKHLRRNDRIENNSVSLNDILAQKAWQERFERRGLAFFYFIKYWATCVETSLPTSKDVQWIYFPGYTRLLRGFLAELKLRPILEYPDALMEAALKLLLNDKLLNPIVKILVTKVPAMDSSAVIRVVEYLNMIFQSVGKRLKQLPVSFDYNFFFKVLQVILDVDFSVAVCSVLTLLYNNFGYFHVEFQRSLSMYLLGSAFYRLFLHWSHNVRYIFNHLLAYKVYKSALKSQAGAEKTGTYVIDATDVVQRYEEMMKIMALQHRNYQARLKNALHPSIDKCLFKKMKIKLYERLKDRQNLSSSSFLNEGGGNKSIQEQVEPDNDFNFKENISILKTAERSNSELWGHRKIRLFQKENDHNTHRKEDIKRSSRFNEFSYEHDHIGKRSTLFHQIIPENEFIIPEIAEPQMKHIQGCLLAYRQIEKGFIEAIEKGIDAPPVIQQEISIDKREIRPRQYDDW